MAEEVKIVVRADGSQAVQELERVNSAKNRTAEPTSGARPQGSMATPPPDLNAKQPPQDQKESQAAAARRNRALIADAEQDLAQSRASGAAPTVIAQRERELRERKLAARFMREQGVGEEAALGQAQSLVGAQTAAKAVAAEQKAAAKAKIEAERNATREMREQETVQKRMGTLTMRLGQAAVTGGSPIGAFSALAAGAGMAGPVGLAAVAAGTLAVEATQDYRERQGIANRDKASRAGDKRNLDIMSGWRGTSGQVQAQQFSTEQEIFEREQERQEILRRNKREWYNPMRLFGETTWAGERERDENEKNITRLEERREKEEKLKTEKFPEEEGGLELDSLRQRSQRTLASIRAAKVNDYVRSGMAEARRLGSMGANPNEQREGAMLKVENDLRDQQIQSASGLVDARSGAGDIAAAARWSQMATPTQNDVSAVLGSKLDVLINHSRQQVDAAWKEDFGK